MSLEERSDESVLKDLIQLTEKKVEETLKNADLTRTIREIIADLKEFGVDLTDPSVGKDTRMRVYDTATRFKDPKFIHHRKFFTKYVAEGKTNPQHFQLYLNYFKKHSCSKEIDAADFEKTCGIGLTYSPEEIQSAVNDVLDAKKDKLETSKWAFGYGQALGEVKKKLTFADSAALVAALDAEIERRVGPKPTVEEIKTVAKQNAKAEKKTVSAPSTTKSDATTTTVKEDDDTEYNTLRDNVQFHDPSENVQVRPELLEEHLRITGGKVRTRFPPEPNGYLHIGHAKSMNLNFGYAKKKGGVCYMRFDDTNPQKEKQEYIDSILSSVEWLGHKPWKITYSSDYFPELFELAVKLIKVGKAFVCHQTAEEMQRDRWAKVDSPWRDRTVEENLRLFYDMKNGKFKEGEAVLRMRGDMKHDNPNMRDLVAYRIKYQPHPHVGDRWCIYPSYDFTHCIVDSLEHITHSLCTLEFENRKISYNWLLQSLDMYNPPQLEFSRLNLTGHAMSKRKLTTLVEEGYVNGWDDPRLPTINGFRRRGYTPQSINNFCERIGITRASNMISHSLLDECCRVDLDKKAPRVMAVLDPLKVTIHGIEGVKELDVPDFPANPDSTTHKVPISNVIYIEREDFNEDSPKGYYRLTPTQSVGLKYFADGNIAVKEVKKDASGKVTELIAELVPKDKVKAHIQWVARPAADQEPFTIEARLYDRLFLVDDLSTVKNYLDALNPNSLNVVKAFVDPSLKVVKGDHVQFERLGFFYRDPDSSENTQIWNLTVTLKQDKTK